ncbi:pyruvate kinase alpha/beta domain-containing protein [Thermodesulfobacteriota bacterium]
MKTYIYIEPFKEGADSIAGQVAPKIQTFPNEVRGTIAGISIGKILNEEEDQFDGLMDELIQVEVPAEYEGNTECICKILTDILRENSPAVLFLGFTHLGMERQLNLTWGVIPALVASFSETDEIFELARLWALEHRIAQSGDRLVITAGAAGKPGTTDLLKVIEIE